MAIGLNTNTSHAHGSNTGIHHMLILTRRVGETLIIGDQVKVSVLRVKGSQVRIGVDAPASVSVHRSEVAERIQNQQPISPGTPASMQSQRGTYIAPRKVKKFPSG